MASGILLLGFAFFPAISLIALYGPLRKRENRIAVHLFMSLLVVAAAVALALAMRQPESQGKVLVAIFTTLLAPSGGIFIALRSAAVGADGRLAFIMLPLGYFAGCGLAIQLLAKLGVVL
ncbi:MAG: hypothetical protein ABI689_05430 [Thermoanaerobaculia bacterium]